MRAEGKIVKAIIWRNVRRHGGDYSIICGRSEVEYCN